MHAGILPVRLALCAVISRHPANLWQPPPRDFMQKVLRW